MPSTNGQPGQQQHQKQQQPSQPPALDKPEVQAALGNAGLSKENPDINNLMQALAAQQQATGLLQKAGALKDKAIACLNPKERNRMLQEAYDKEVQAHGQSVWAKRMQSGVWQGGAGGAGIGGGVGVGLGAAVGTVTGGVLSLPTTALGGLVGAGVGGVTGPWFKLDQGKAKEVAERERGEGKSEEEVQKAVAEEAVVEDTEKGASGEGAEDGSAPPAHDAAISQPEPGSAQRNLQRQHSISAAANLGPDGETKKARKKPRKLEVRNSKKAAAEMGDEGKENRPGGE
ncbi:hypothetical protein B0A50_01031 [Salinomyces thailandicus]|uniref:Glycine zipper domain-containing protein n=1 Tax=Salinomyces thailandicus TaxID=706561 RepID=A0A4U0UE32_9PEZI|nr:hypothetical protein B0A50_01031 [Salinomyces thailandica]